MSSAISSTVAVLPATIDIQRKTEIPFGLVINPFASANIKQGDPLPTCMKCAAYACSASVVNPQSRTWACPFCGFEENQVIDSSLFDDAVEWDTNQCRRPPSVILIDASISSFDGGFVDILMKSLPKMLRSYGGEMIISCYASTLRFMKPDGSIVETEVGELPKLEDVLISDSEYDLSELLDSPLNGTTDLEAVLRGFVDFLPSGSLIYLFQATLPKTFNRPFVVQDLSVLKGSNLSDGILDIVNRFKLKNIVMKSLMFTNQQRLIDVITIGRMSVMTGGSLFSMNITQKHYPDRVLEDFLSSSPVLCSLRSSSLMLEPSVGVNSYNPSMFYFCAPRSLVFPFKPCFPLRSPPYVQLVVHHISSEGRRIIRVITKTFKTSSDHLEVFSSIDQMCTTKLITGLSISRVLQERYTSREMEEFCAGIITPYIKAFRLHGTEESDLVIPPNANRLLLNVLALIKSVPYTSKFSLDERGWYFYALDLSTPSLVSKILYPTLTDVTDAVFNGQEPSPPLRLHFSSLNSKKLFLLADGLSSWLLFGKGLNKEAVRRIFNGFSASVSRVLEPNDSQESVALFQMLNGNIKFFQDDKNEAVVFKDRLIEDMTSSSTTYRTFISYLAKATEPPKKKK